MSTQLKWFFALLFVALVVIGVRFSQNGLKLYNASGDLIQETTPEELAKTVRAMGKNVILVNFWASWCGPCKEEFPHLLKLRETHAAKGFDVVFVSIDGPQEKAAALNFLKAQKVDFTTYYKGDQSLNFVSQIFPKWSGAVPASVIFNEKMEILDAWEGDTSLEEFEARVSKHLNQGGGA